MSDGREGPSGWGRVLFPITMIGLGVASVVNGDFAPIWQPVPKTMPGREPLIYLCALVSIGTGLALLWRPAARIASRILVAYLLAWLLLLRVPNLFLGPTIDVVWAVGKVLVVVAAAWVLYAWFARDDGDRLVGLPVGDRGLRIARALCGLAFIPFGIAHFVYLELTAPLVPAWLPGHVAWAYLTGAAFIAAGLGMITGIWARLAATLSVVEMGGFTLIVWVPIVSAGHPNAFQRTELIVSWVLTAAAWVVADSYRGMPWTAVNRR